MKFSKILIAGFIIVLGAKAFAQKTSEKYEKLQIEMFPKVKDGYKQVYIQLPIAKNEDQLKVEFYVGFEKMMDCNNYSLLGNTKSQNLDGWGYNYYEIESKGETIGTLMGCANQKLTKKFVFIQPQIVRYNSKLPLVFYIPKDLEVRYRIFRADPTMKKAVQK